MNATERTSGLRAVLSSAAVYEGVQRALGVNRFRAVLVAEHLDVAPGARVLDIGCGPGSMLRWLPGVRYVGFDPSERYIDQAVRRFGERGSFVVGGIGDVDPAELGEFDLVLAQGVLHHLDDAGASRLFELARVVLAPGGRACTVDPCFAPGQHPVARSLIARDRGMWVRDEAGYRAIAEQVFPVVGSVVRHDLLRIPYTHALIECAQPGGPDGGR